MQLKFKQKIKSLSTFTPHSNPIKINALMQLKFKQKIKSLLTFTPHSNLISNKKVFLVSLHPLFK